MNIAGTNLKTPAQDGIIYGAMRNPFTWSVFFAGAFANAVPGIIVHIILIPALVFALRKAKLSKNK